MTAFINIEQQDFRNFTSRWFTLKKSKTSLLTVYLKLYSLRKIVKKMTQSEWCRNTFKEMRLNEFKRMKRMNLSLFLRKLADRERAEVINHRTLHSISVFTLQLFVSWQKVYWMLKWFRAVYVYVSTENLLKSTSVSFLQKCLNYWVNEDFRLWVHWEDLHLLCISEFKVVSALYKAHDNDDHWVKDSITLKLHKLVYWLFQFTDMKQYIAECLFCIKHASAQ